MGLDLKLPSENIQSSKIKNAKVMGISFKKKRKRFLKSNSKSFDKVCLFDLKAEMFFISMK